jgi:PBP1b-binding outer membrane lipoprotein LpoB
MKLFISMAAVCLLLTGCPATVPPKAIYTPVKVEVAVPVPCIKASDIPVEPAYKLDSLDPQVNLYEKTVAALEEIEQRKKWQKLAKIVMNGCAAIQ